jgi:hypothetical protein
LGRENVPETVASPPLGLYSRRGEATVPDGRFPITGLVIFYTIAILLLIKLA